MTDRRKYRLIGNVDDLPPRTPDDRRQLSNRGADVRRRDERLIKPDGIELFDDANYWPLASGKAGISPSP
jgi:hypothetical protein